MLPKIEQVFVALVCISALLAGMISYSYFTAPYRGLPKPSLGHKWSQVFNDEFRGKTIDPSKWVDCYDWYSTTYNGCTNSGNNELEWYTTNQVTEQKGYVQLKAVTAPIIGLNISNQTQTYSYQSGMISTGRPIWNSQPKEEFRYGYFEARIKVSSGKGIWPAFWLLPSNHNWPPEIDIMEILGDAPSNVLMTYHWGDASAPQKDVSILGA